MHILMYSRHLPTSGVFSCCSLYLDSLASDIALVVSLTYFQYLLKCKLSEAFPYHYVI